jgi:CBS domain-containing protein
VKVKDVMTTDVLTVRPDTSFKDTVELLVENHVSGVPVVDADDRLVGIIARQDLLRIFQRSDADIAAEIDVKLLDPMYAPEEHSVTAVVEDGVVTLLGSVRYSGELPVIEGLANNVPGVVQIDSRLTYDIVDVK